MTVSSINELPIHQRGEVLRLLASGQYQVLLGAGASADSTDRNGNPLPLGRALAKELCDKFAIPLDEDLAMSYERAIRGGRENEVYEFLRNRFTQTQPAAWYSDFVDLPWKRLWTLNVDDAVPRAYKRYASLKRRIEAISWNEPFSEGHQLQLIHLHGRCTGAEPTELVFSIVEYLRARDARRSWHSILADQWGRRPFIVIGAGLRDEVDLADILRAHPASPDLPTLYVSRTIDDLMAEDLEAWGVIPIQQNASDFVSEIAVEVAPHLASERGPLGEIAGHETVAFLQEFRQLRPDQVDAPPRHHDLYRGDQPRWSDIVSDLDAEFRWTNDLASGAMASLRSGEQAVHVAIGGRFSGKSTGLLRVGKLLNDAGFFPFLFRNEEPLDERSLISILEKVPSAAILFDGLADHAHVIARILRKCQNEDIPCVVVAVERDVRLPVLLSDIDDRHFTPTHLQEIVEAGKTYRRKRRVDLMREEDSEALVDKLASKARLGTFEDQPRKAVARRFATVGLFAGLEEATRGRQFRDRVSELTEQLDSRPHRLLATAVTLIDTLGYSSPSEVVDAVESVAGEFVDFDDDKLREFILVDRDRVEARHRSVALRPLLTSCKKGEISDLVVGIHMHLRPYVNSATMGSGSRYALVARGLMRARSLEHWIGASNMRAFYDQLDEIYGDWNSRYWEQRAIAAELTHDWEAAESYAARAATDSPDEKRLTTLASIVMNRAAQDASPGSERAVELATRSLEIFEDARRYKPSNYVPVVACLSGLLRLAETLQSTGIDVHEQFGRDWNHWTGHARANGASRFGPIGREIEDLNYAWIQMGLE